MGRRQGLGPSRLLGRGPHPGGRVRHGVASSDGQNPGRRRLGPPDHSREGGRAGGQDDPRHGVQAERRPLLVGQVRRGSRRGAGLSGRSDVPDARGRAGPLGGPAAAAGQGRLPRRTAQRTEGRQQADDGDALLRGEGPAAAGRAAAARRRADAQSASGDPDDRRRLRRLRPGRPHAVLPHRRIEAVSEPHHPPFRPAGTHPHGRGAAGRGEGAEGRRDAALLRPGFRPQQADGPGAGEGRHGADQARRPQRRRPQGGRSTRRRIRSAIG